MRSWRKMTLVLILFTLLMAAWAIAGGSATDCGNITDEAERIGCEAGTGIGVVLLFFVWFIGFIILSVIWFMTRPKGRNCPRCGENVKKGRMECPSCGFDFKTVGQPATTA